MIHVLHARHETFYMARFRTTVYLNKARLKVSCDTDFKCAFDVYG